MKKLARRILISLSIGAVIGTAVGLAMGLSGCGSSGGAKAAPVDFSKPEAVLGAVFAAARSGDTSQLAGLCADDADGDARRICGGTKGSKDWGSFVEYFAKGAIKGEPRIDGDKAEVDFTFGPDGSKEETMRMAQVDGKWLLSSF